MTRMDRQLWDAGEVAGDLVPAGSVFAFLARYRGELFDDAFIADLFPKTTGRPSLPADLVGSVLVLKELYDLSDRQTADALMFDIRWKVATGRSLTQTSFDPSTLVYWRKRIAASKRPDRVFDKVAEVIGETGILRGRRKRCQDSTIFDDAVATQDTVTQLVVAIRKVARLVPGAAEVVAAVCTLDYTRLGKPDIDWDDPDAKKQLVSDLVNDALAVLERLTGPDQPERDQAAADALGLLALVAGQDVEPAEGSDGTDGRWVIARRVAPDRVISTVDPQARHTRKSRSSRKDGYRGHLAAEPETGLITDAEMTSATGEGNTDAAVGVRMASRDRFTSTGTSEAGAANADTAGDSAASTTGAADTGAGSADVDTADAEEVHSGVSTPDADTPDAAQTAAGSAGLDPVAGSGGGAADADITAGTEGADVARIDASGTEVVHDRDAAAGTPDAAGTDMVTDSSIDTSLAGRAAGTDVAVRAAGTDVAVRAAGTDVAVRAAGTDVAVRGKGATDVATKDTSTVHSVVWIPGVGCGTSRTADADTTAGSITATGTRVCGTGLKIYADSAYGTGEARAAYLSAGHDAVIKPKPLTPAVAGGFTLDDFTVDESARTVTCPAGNTRPMSPARTVTFGQLCAGCPLRQRCTTAKAGRSMTIHEHEGLLRAARARARTAEYKQDYPTRANIERTVAQVATQNGRRVKLRYLGTVKNNAWLRTRCAALNLRTLLKHGLTRRDGTWAAA
jgi:Transposase DDE domain/Transposase domain (DUF772)